MEIKATHEMGIWRVVTAMDGLTHEAKAPVSSNFAMFFYYNHLEVNKTNALY